MIKWAIVEDEEMTSECFPIAKTNRKRRQESYEKPHLQDKNAQEEELGWEGR